MHRQAKYSFLLAMLSATCGRYLCEGLVIPFPGGNADADVSKEDPRTFKNELLEKMRSSNKTDLPVEALAQRVAIAMECMALTEMMLAKVTQTAR